MRKEGVVSLFVGKVNREDALNQWVTETYDDDGEYHRPPFAVHLGIRYFDSDFFEAKFVGAPAASIPEAVASSSYGAQIGPRLAEAAGSVPSDYDTIILLYEFEYGAAERGKAFGKVWRHIATAPYEKADRS